MNFIQKLTDHMYSKPPNGSLEEGNRSVYRRMIQNIIRLPVVPDRNYQLVLQ